LFAGLALLDFAVAQLILLVTSRYLGWQDDARANAEHDGAKAWRENRLRYTGPPDGYAHAAWARLRNQAQIDEICKPPQPPADLLAQIERLQRRTL
jgi:hypothetical protein